MTLYVERPSHGTTGVLRLVAEYDDGTHTNHEAPVSGPHDDATLEKVFNEMMSYYRTGKRSVNSRINGDDYGKGKGFNRG